MRRSSGLVVEAGLALTLVGIAAAVVASSSCGCAPGSPGDRGQPLTGSVNTGQSSSAADRSASVPDVKLLSQRLVTRRAVADGDSSDGGHGWGAHKLRIVRSTGGTLFTVYPSGRDPLNKTYNLMRSTNRGRSWSRINDGLTINGRPDDGGRETSLLLISPSNVVYLIGWAGGMPTLITEGVNGAGPYSARPIPGPWQSGDNWPYSGAAIDSSGNLYVEENTAASTSGPTEDSGQIMSLAWTTGGTGHFAWHSTRLPSVANADYRHTYSFDLPGAGGAFDVVATRAVSCNNAKFASQYGYSGASPNQYVLDSIEDWHTDNINADEGPTWTITNVAHNYTNTCGHGFINNNEFAQDAYRDTHGNVHVMYFDGVAKKGRHAVLGSAGSSWGVRTSVTLPRGYCDNEARITQDGSGRFYVVSQCNNHSLYVWPANRTNGNALGRVSTLRLSRPINGWDYFAAPSGGTPTNQNYLDMVYPTTSATRLAYVRVKLARRRPLGSSGRPHRRNN
jgi:hypothetical protein